MHETNSSAPDCGYPVAVAIVSSLYPVQATAAVDFVVALSVVKISCCFLDFRSGH